MRWSVNNEKHQKKRERKREEDEKINNLYANYE